MPMTNEQLKAISDSDFGLILEEFRSRGYAVAAYGVAEFGEGPLQDVHGNYDAAHCAAYLKDNREGLEDAMCSAVWDYCKNDDAVNAPQCVLRHSADL